MDAASITLGGVAVEPTTVVRLTVNNFLADGGDGFTGFLVATDRLGGGVDVDSFESYLAAAGPAGVAPPATDRIDVVP